MPALLHAICTRDRRCEAASVRICLAGSAGYVAVTCGNKPAISGTPILPPAQAPTTSGIDFKPRSAAMRSANSLGACASTERRAARTASRPIQKPLPSSPKYGPQPPTRNIEPFLSRPMTMDPVPAMSKTPGSTPMAPMDAMKASLSMMV